jgi:cell division protein FtsB
MQSILLRRRPANPIQLAWAALVACLVVGSVGLVAYQLESRKQARAEHDRISVEDRFQKVAEEKKSIDELLYTQTKNLSQLREQISQKEQQLTKLRSELRTASDRVKEPAGTSSTDASLQEDSKQRDALISQLRDAEQAYQNVQGQLASLLAERDKALVQSASLESTIQQLTTTNRDLERRLNDDEQYLASDRDIRELMGARKLYIADVFDVDGRSRTRKPFGRIFYTQGKSLLFYAFDLNDQPDLKKVETFQAWGRNDSDSGKPLNLGIFYLDSETNRRWVLRFDDSTKLTEINAVFVTVEPHGGSRKPTGKPFLYALLRKEANHP